MKARLIDLVARVPAPVRVKLLVAFLAMAALLLVVGLVGLETLAAVNRRAEEHFLPAGPFAILPLKGRRSSLVWTENEDEAKRIVALPDDAFHEELERRFGLVGGDIFHGALSLDQLWAARPVLGYGAYRGPIRGLYMCGSGTHPGGGVTGLPGMNAAREILRDWKKLS